MSQATAQDALPLCEAGFRLLKLRVLPASVLGFEFSATWLRNQEGFKMAESGGDRVCFSCLGRQSVVPQGETGLWCRADLQFVCVVRQWFSHW